MLRICFVIDALHRAGTENQLRLLLRALDRARVEPSLVLLDGRDPASRELEPDDLSVHRLGITKLASAHAWRQAAWFRRFLRDARIDAVQTFFPDSTLFAAVNARIMGVPVIGSRRHAGHAVSLVDRPLAHGLQRICLEAVIANSEAARASVIAQEGARPGQVHVIPNGIDLSRFDGVATFDPRSPGGHPRVGMLGNLRPVKGCDVFIRAAGAIAPRHPDVEFRIGGAGDPAAYAALAASLDLDESLALLGAVADVPGFLSTLHVAVLPSRSEGLSGALMEYMASGRPIVATDVGGNRELIDHGVNGLLVGSEDPAAMAAAMARLIDDPGTAARLARKARQDVASYATERLAARYTDLVERLVARRRETAS